MSILDISLLIILVGFVVNGLIKGLINLIGRLLALFVGIYLAGHFHEAIFYWAREVFNISGNEFLGKIITFIIIFILVTFFVDLIFRMLEKVFNLLAIIPGSKYINNLAGAILGFLEGSLFLGLIIFTISHYAEIGELVVISERLDQSMFVPILLVIVDFFLPFLPAALRILKELI